MFDSITCLLLALQARWFRCLALVAAACGAACPAQAAPADTGSGTADVQTVVIEPLRLVKSRDLSFGSIANATSSGTVTVDPASSNCATTGPLLHIGTCAAAEFVGMGTANHLVLVRVQNITSLTGPGADMTMTNFAVDGAPDLNAAFSFFGLSVLRIMPSNGIFDFRVGARLNVNANQAPGSYAGTFEVRIDYF